MLKKLIPLSLLLIAPLSSGCRATGTSAMKVHDEATVLAPGEFGTGHYVGTLTPEKTTTKIATVMDLVETRNDATSANYRAVFRIVAGGFGSHEYGDVYFRDVTLDKKANLITFAGGPDGVTLTDAKLVNGTLRARFASVKDQATATLELQAIGDQTPKGRTNVSHVTGNYVGSCPGAVVSLQVEASKWRGLRPTDSGLFGGYRFTGRTGQTDDITCGVKQTCVKEGYAVGTYNILTGALAFKTSTGEKLCHISGDSVTCDNCTMVKDPISPHAVLDVQRDFKIHQRAEHIPRGKDALDADDKPRLPKKMTGQYYGYVHHKRSDVYQLVALNVKAEPQVDGTGKPTGQQHVGGVASLYFGEGDSNEFIAYRFKEEMWPVPSGHFVFDGDGEAMLIVDRWTDKAIFGKWYSKSYGEVGTVELQRDLVPGLSSAAEGLAKISGAYHGDDWDFELSVSANISEDQADFFPLKVYGWARENIEHSRRRTIEEGTYDFYTGAVAFRLDDSRVVAGRITPAGMQLFWPPLPRLGTPLISGVTQLFRKVVETEAAKQAKLSLP